VKVMQTQGLRHSGKAGAQPFSEVDALLKDTFWMGMAKGVRKRTPF